MLTVCVSSNNIFDFICKIVADILKPTFKGMTFAFIVFILDVTDVILNLIKNRIKLVFTAIITDNNDISLRLQLSDKRQELNIGIIYRYQDSSLHLNPLFKH